MTFREFVQQRRNQQLAEGSKGRAKTQRALMNYFSTMFGSRGIPRRDRSKFAIEPWTGLMHNPKRILQNIQSRGPELITIPGHPEIGDPSQDTVDHYTARALNMRGGNYDPESFKALMLTHKLRHVPRFINYSHKLGDDTHQHLDNINAAIEMMRRKSSKTSPTNPVAKRTVNREIDRLYAKRGEVQDIFHNVVHKDDQPLHPLRKVVPRTSVKPSPVRIGSVPQSHYLQSRLQQNRKRLEQLGKSPESDSDSPLPRKD